uniref:Bifunctional protein GlmU n=1 Tax=Solibacter usitatus (strain Ellin6076) TaxID=234267 RepID=GLMU_SOLUE|nr:RecName: Full=Bifunctional protein GlmU; Includes: RecName: Full=UDP-N-acetylglucosamine pyrophosphorylase; AltName: Full=N-acetylglucosamine-1-phosphate uridyltransferase; Includes: RecName: Full=Glucosamine-1-phosphate N-acetyltransferase [Candidatus Solibacter usitatus Ellin6076]
MEVMPQPLTIVILAAGLGTRMKSRHAKVLHQAGGKTLLQHVIDTALELAPAERIFVVVGHQAEKVRQSVTTPGIGFIEQTEQKGTGHAVLIGRHALAGLDGHLMVLYGDCPLLRTETLRRLIAQAAEGPAAGVLLSAMMDDPYGYGRVIRDSRGHVLDVVEQKSGTPEQLAIKEANMGIYCFRAGLFWEHVGEIEPNNPAGEYYLTDMPAILHRAGHTVEAMRIDDPAEALGINDRAQLAEVDRIFRDRKRRAVMAAGVTLIQPETITIDPAAEIGQDSIIESFAQILGKTKIGENCRVGSCSIVSDSTLADEVHIGAFTIVTTSVLEHGVHAGPYARLRMENHVEAGAHIGNFVELKKTRMGKGAKANHLAYLGDSEIGARVNIGAGTITCNYDGFKKHRTGIGEGAFVGSNSTLVAPIDIGEGAYVAAGSVITNPVPPDALALGRARQEIKEEWAKKRRKLAKT